MGDVLKFFAVLSILGIFTYFILAGFGIFPCESYNIPPRIGSLNYNIIMEKCVNEKDVWRLEVECIKHDNDGWMNSTTITTHIHSFKYYQTYSDYKEMVEGYEECEVRG